MFLQSIEIWNNQIKYWHSLTRRLDYVSKQSHILEHPGNGDRQILFNSVSSPPFFLWLLGRQEEAILVTVSKIWAILLPKKIVLFWQSSNVFNSKEYRAVVLIVTGLANPTGHTSWGQSEKIFHGKFKINILIGIEGIFLNYWRQEQEHLICLFKVCAHDFFLAGSWKFDFK